MKKTFIFLMVCLPLLLCGQTRGNRNFLIGEDTLRQKAKLTGKDGVLFWEASTARQSLSGEKSHFRNFSTQLNYSDLQLELQLNDRHQKYQWHFELGLLTEKGDTITPAINRLQGDIDNIEWGKTGRYELVWLDVVEEKLTFQEEYEFFLTSQLKGDLDCASDPVQFFRLEKEWPYIAGLTLSGSALLTGAVLRNQAANDYDEYLDIWSSEAGAFNEGNRQLSKAGNAKDQSDVFLIVGGITFLGQALLLGKRYLAVRRQQKDYRFYCSRPGWDIQPSLLVLADPNPMSPDLVPGVRLSLAF
jgi:hypothetical protein